MNDIRASVAVLRDGRGSVTDILNLCEETKTNVWRRWDAPDKVLERIQGRDLMKGRTRYSDLLPAQFRVLIALHASLLSECRRESQTNMVDFGLRNLKDITAAFLMYLEMTTDSHIPMIEITCHTRLDISYQFTANAPRSETGSNTVSTSGLRIVVDNRGS